jgi:hypothetical protein
MLGIERVTGNATSTSDSGNASTQRWHCIALARRRQVDPNHLGRGWHGDEIMPLTPSLVVRKVGGIEVIASVVR